MMALRRFYLRIRPGVWGRTAIYLVLTAGLIFLIYVLRGGQPVTYMGAVRRAEQAVLLGPGEVVKIVDLAGEGRGVPGELVGKYYTRIYVLKESDRMALAVTSRTRHGLVFTETDAGVVPVEAREGVTLGAVGQYVGRGLGEPKYIFAFDDHPGAVRAVLTAAYDEEDVTQGWYAPGEGGKMVHMSETGDVHLVYTAEAEREDGGMFVFRFDAKNPDSATFEGQAEERLFMTLGTCGFYYGEDMEGRTGLRLCVSFYDEKGEVVGEEEAVWGF